MIGHTIIVGGGVIGLSLAWELTRRRIRVTVLERDRIGIATSWAAAGILPPARFDSATDPIDKLRGLSHQIFPSWVKELQQRTSIDSGFRRCGGWYLSDSHGERATMLGMTGYWADVGIECESASLDVLAAREPALADWAMQTSNAAAWWVPDECQIRPPRYLQALHQACRLGGVDIREQAPVVDIRPSSSSPAALVHDQWLEADAIVVCGGPWTGKIAPILQLEQSIVPIRGQILLLKTDKPIVQSVINLGHRYVLSRDDGTTLIGSCEEEAGFVLDTEESMLSSLEQFAVTLIPQLRAAQRVSAWAGLRPLTFDGFPMIGKVPEWENLYVAAGHFRSGLHLSPGTAVTLADQMLGIDPPVNLDAFGVGKQQSRTNIL